jgi:hypothetical protein
MEDLSKKYDERTLRLIIGTLLESGLEHDTEFDNDMCDEIDDALKYIGIEPKNWEDYTFYFQLLRINPNYETESINVPNLHKYNVDTDVRVYESAEETWRREVYSYFNSKDMITQQVENNTDDMYWEGEMIHREVYDSSHEDERIINIQRVEYRNKK